MAERAERETAVLKVAGSKPIHSKVILIRGFFHLFVFHFIKLLLVVFWFLRSTASPLSLHVFIHLLAVQVNIN